MFSGPLSLCAYVPEIKFNNNNNYQPGSIFFRILQTHVHACTRMYTHVHACTRMYTHVHACTRMYTHVHACTRMYTHARTHARTHTPLSPPYRSSQFDGSVEPNRDGPLRWRQCRSLATEINTGACGLISPRFWVFFAYKKNYRPN